MAESDLHRVILGPLHRTGLVYMVTGSVAAIAYGEPRMTNDVDLVLRLGEGDAIRLLATFKEPDYYAPPLDAVENERARTRHGHFNILHRSTALRADVYLAGNDPLHTWALERRLSASVGGDPIWFAPVEYVVVRKLEYFVASGSDRHLGDIRGILRVSADLVNTAELDPLIAERGLSAAWLLAKSG